MVGLDTVVCFTKMHPVLLKDIENASHVKWMNTGMPPSKFFPNLKFAKLVLWSTGVLSYFDDLSLIREEWKDVEPEDFLDKCKEMFPKEQKDEKRS